jgi:hypothetical protein
MTNFISILIISAILGFTMKVADLLDEHGLKWFKGSAILFGLLWGASGALILVLGPNALAMFWLATFLTYIIKAQIDYINHGIAEIIILFTFFYNQNSVTINWPVFLYFFIAIGLTGLFNKYFIEQRNMRGIVEKVFKWRSHYNLIALLFSIYSGIWIVFFSRIMFWVFYEIANVWGLKKIATQKTGISK